MYSLLGFLITIGILVTLHELGHYGVARWCGVKVLRFSFGFGPVLFSRRFGRDQTEWAFSAVPLGGYVRMLDERDDEVREMGVTESDLSRAFNRQNVWKRIAIVGAGPLANLLLAILLLAAMYLVGVPGLQPVLSQPAAGTAAAVAGFQSMDRIVAVEGRSVAVWQDVNQRILNANISSEAVLTVEREGRSLKIPLALTAMAQDDGAGNQLERLGLHPYAGAMVRGVIADSPATDAGLRAGDRLRAIDGAVLDTPSALRRLLSQSAGMTVELTLIRDGVTMTVPIVPREETDESGRPVTRIGVTIMSDPEEIGRYRVTVRHGALDALAMGALRTWDLTVLSFKMIGRMIVGSASLKNLSGPLTIADYAGQSIQAGFQQFMTYLALISIGLGVLNLLPVPLLDGGHLLYYLAEIIRGRPLPERAFEIGQRIGLALIVTLIALALLNDFSRLF
ncbi:MAG: RIP metalloprotease RseP [Proteobacteria bacterium]|nr:RIP metalloprotease RseP [Pseudomonadota bacterium]MCL2307628.1 RIP metalloprotease RseP [Pseudomonadota bacterium]